MEGCGERLGDAQRTTSSRPQCLTSPGNRRVRARFLERRGPHAPAGQPDVEQILPHPSRVRLPHRWGKRRMPRYGVDACACSWSSPSRRSWPWSAILLLTRGTRTRRRPRRPRTPRPSAPSRARPRPCAGSTRDRNKLLGGGADAFEERVEELRGYPVVVNKWASWCGPCRAEFPVFQKAAVQEARRIAFLGVDSNDNDDDARRVPRTSSRCRTRATRTRPRGRAACSTASAPSRPPRSTTRPASSRTCTRARTRRSTSCCATRAATPGVGAPMPEVRIDPLTRPAHDRRGRARRPARRRLQRRAAPADRPGDGPLPRGPRGPHAARAVRAAPGRRRARTRPAGPCAWCRTSTRRSSRATRRRRRGPGRRPARARARRAGDVRRAPGDRRARGDRQRAAAGGVAARARRRAARAWRWTCWRERMRAHDGAAYVHVIVNEGREAGASLPHTHAQLYALPFVPHAIARERERFTAYSDRTQGRNLLEDLLQEEVRLRERLVAYDSEAVAICPFASRVPFQVQIVPRAPRARFEDEGPLGAALLHEVLGRLERRARRAAAAQHVGPHGAARGGVLLLADRHAAAADAPRGARARRRASTSTSCRPSARPSCCARRDPDRRGDRGRDRGRGRRRAPLARRARTRLAAPADVGGALVSLLPIAIFFNLGGARVRRGRRHRPRVRLRRRRRDGRRSPTWSARGCCDCRGRRSAR